MTPDNAARLARAKEAMELAEKATRADWRIISIMGQMDLCHDVHTLPDGTKSYAILCWAEFDDQGGYTGEVAWRGGEDDRAFIVAARTLVPDLAADVKALVAENRELKQLYEASYELGSTWRRRAEALVAQNNNLRAEVAEALVEQLKVAVNNWRDLYDIAAPRAEAAEMRVAELEAPAPIASNKAHRQRADNAEAQATALRKQVTELKAALKTHTPYREWCRNPLSCHDKGSCPRDPNCAD